MDHKNLTHKLSTFTTQRVMRWRLLLEEFGPEFKYKKGSENCVADALSRVPTLDENVTPAMPETRCVKVDDLWTECLWAMPKFDEQNCHPFQFETLSHYQQKSQKLTQLLNDFPDDFVVIHSDKLTSSANAAILFLLFVLQTKCYRNWYTGTIILPFTLKVWTASN
jgi:hypothetical protein